MRQHRGPGRRVFRPGPDNTFATVNIGRDDESKQERETTCALCGQQGNNSVEHLPPESVQLRARDAGGTDFTKLRAMPVMDWNDNRPRNIHTHKKGFHVKSLCQPCNHALGRLVNSDYLPFVESMIARDRGPRKVIPTYEIKQDLHALLRVVASMFLSLNAARPAPATPWEDVQRFVRGDVASVDMPCQIRAYRVPKNPSVGTLAGTHGLGHLTHPDTRLIASEIGWYPVGFLLVFEASGGWAKRVAQLPDIAPWAKLSPEEAARGTTLRLPMRQTSVIRDVSPFVRVGPLVIGAWGY